jgi:translation initiation factor IF-2
MSSNESSGAAAEATATTPAPSAEFPTFGSTRGSGLARGKRPAAGPAASAAAAPSNYTPTAIEVVNAPREYTNPFAPVEAAPAAETAAPAAPVVETAPAVSAPAPAPVTAVAPVAEEPAQLNILPPAEQKPTTAQTWESDGFAPTREPRSERPRREERPRYEAPREESANEPVDIASIPEKFLYVRPGVTYVPTPRNWGGAPRERGSRPAGEASVSSPAKAEGAAYTPAAAPAKSGGFFGWLKSLFGGAAPAEQASAGAGSSSQRREGGERSHRGGRNRGGRGGEGGGHRRSRGGRGRGRSGGGYPPAEGSSQGGI